MHMVCLGIVRKLIFFWLDGQLSTRLSSTTVQAISFRMLSYVTHMPRDFARKPRPLQEIKMWKATELRQFLLYTGPVVLYKKVTSPVYRNFLLLSASMRILLDSDMHGLSYDFVEQLLEVFVANFSNIYGRKTISYNVHSLLPIVDDARKFGPLSNISCFPFENYLGN